MKRAIFVFAWFALLLSACANDSGTGKIALVAQPKLGAGIYRLKGMPAVQDLSWSPNGKYLTGLSSYRPMPDCFGCGKGYSEIFTVDLGTLERNSVLRFDASKYMYSVSWFPDSTMLAYVTDADSPARFGQSWSIGIDGQDNAPFMDFERKPVWSPDGLKIAAASHTGSPPDWYATIVEVDAQTSRIETVFEGNAPVGQISEPSWSPDGQQLAFTHGGYGSPPEYIPPRDAFILNVQTRQLTQLTHGAQCTFAKFSPAGSLMALGCGAVTLRDLASKCEVRLPISGVWQATWSPDGRKIAITDYVDVYVVDLGEYFGPKFVATGSLCP